MGSNIEWTEETWNPVVGCDKVSPGCKYCYAIRMAWRLAHIGHSKEKYKGLVVKNENGQLNWTGKVNYDPRMLAKYIGTKTPKTVFPNSMGDIFHEELSVVTIAEIFAAMWLTPHVTYQLLTKREKRMEMIMNSEEFMIELHKAANRLHDQYIKPLESELYFYGEVAPGHSMPNVQIGVSVENQEAADQRIPPLINTPAAIRWISMEPLLGPVDISKYNMFSYCPEENGTIDSGCRGCKGDSKGDCQAIIRSPIDWVVVGGESGKDARPMHPEWARSLRDQCAAAKIPFFFKQWGVWHTRWFHAGKKEFDFKFYDSYLQFTQKDWVQKGDACISIDGTRCKIGKDFMNCAYPVAIMQKVGKKKAGRLLDGKLHDDYPKNII